MRIAINARLLHSPRPEGISRYAREVIDRWVRDHPEHEYHLIYDRRPAERLPAADHVYHHVTGLPARTPILWRLWFEYFFYKKIKSLSTDVIFSPESYMCLKADVPTIITTHDIAYARLPQYGRASHRLYYDRYFPQYHDRAAHIITVSDFSKKEIIDYYGIDANRITRVYNGISLEFSPLSANTSQPAVPYFLYVGSIHPRKNVKRLIEAYEVLKSNGYPHQLLIVGRWAWMYDDVERAIRDSPYRSDIQVISDDSEDINALLHRATALCYLSIYEGFGLPPVEAMAAGCPVIASDVTAMPEVCGNAALLVSPMDVESIAEAMMRIADDTELRDQLIIRGLAQVKRYSWNISAERIYDVLATTATRRS